VGSYQSDIVIIARATEISPPLLFLSLSLQPSAFSLSLLISFPVDIPDVSISQVRDKKNRFRD